MMSKIYYFILLISILFLLYYFFFSKKDDNDDDIYEVNEKKEIFIVSITTSPRRIKLMQKTLESILSQSHPPDLIRINIPLKFKRTGEYYDIPDFIKNNQKIQIFQYNQDYGPLMKLMQTLLDYNDNPNVNIIYTDDDVLMLPNTIETYKNYIKINSNFVYCLSGFEFNLTKWNRNFQNSCFVNVPEGYMSVCLSSSVINKLKQSSSISDYYSFISKNEFCFTSDDLMIANFLAMNEIKIYKIHDDKANFSLWWSSGCELSYGRDGDGIMHMEQDQHFTRYNKAFQYLVENNMNFLI